jgi:acylaminoacyl-peptidase
MSAFVSRAALGLLAGCFLSLWAGHVRGEDEPHVLQPIDVFQLEYASDPRVSPDGTRIVYLRNRMDIQRDRVQATLWIIHSDGSEHRPLVSDGSDTVSGPRWSPGGDRLVYVTSGEDSGGAQIFCRWMETGETARLTQLAEAPANLSWSPDGTQIAFTMLVPEKPDSFVELPKAPEGAKWADPPRVIDELHYRHDGQGYIKPGHRHVFVLPAEGGTPRQLTDGEFQNYGPLSWSADGESIFFNSNRNDDWEHQPRESDIYQVALADESLTQITDRVGPDQAPAVSPDGTMIAYVGFDDEKQSLQNTQLTVMTLDSGETRVLTAELDREVWSPVWDDDSRALSFLYTEEGNTRIGHVTLNGEITELAQHVGGTSLGRPYAGGSFSTNGKGVFAYAHSTADHPADVAVIRKNNDDRRITHLNHDLFSQRDMAKVEEFWFPSSVDGRKIQGWIVYPPGFDASQKYPFILEIHGGPFADYGDRFSAEFQYYAAAGYVVLYANPGGSTGYGEEFGNSIHHTYPGRDYHDLMSGVDAILEKGFIDEDNLFVTGGSGGGIMTAWIVTKTNRFRAAASIKPVINWYSFALTTDAYPYFTQYWFPGPPWEHTEQYLQRSPIAHVGNVETPTLLMTGEADYRTPISESEQFYQALKLRHIDTMLIRVPDSSHFISSRPSRLIMKTGAILKWFERYREEVE